MIKGFALIAVLLALLTTQTTSTTWDDWNTYASNHYSTVQALPIPAVPRDFQRYVDSSNSTYIQRRNQYRFKYKYTVGGTECNIICGPRSFLVLDSGSGNYLCQRDTYSQFWGGQSGYGDYCIPDVDTNLACNVAVSTLAYVGNCNMATYSDDPFYKNYECCYDDNNYLNPKSTDLTLKSATTTHYKLRNAE